MRLTFSVIRVRVRVSNFLTVVGWITMKLATDNHDVQRNYPNDFADSLTSRSKMLFVQTFMVPRG